MLSKTISRIQPDDTVKIFIQLLQEEKIPRAT